MMTPRETEVVRTLLDVLHCAQPTLLAEPVAHGNVSVRLTNAGQPAVTLDEFNTALRFADAAGLLRSDRNHFTGNLRWTISAEGRVALKEMR